MLKNSTVAFLNSPRYRKVLLRIRDRLLKQNSVLELAMPFPSELICVVRM
jgi:hypothetical protein